LSAIHALGWTFTRFYQASTSELFGSSPPPQSEKTPFHPRSPYAVAKLYGYWITINYREAYNMFAVNGILFNHESERRGETFVTRKITLAAARIAKGLQKKLYLGNLSAQRDWGYAKDYVECMWLMLQQNNPADYVVATGETHTLEEFVAETFRCLDLDWRRHVSADPTLLRPLEIINSRANPQLAREVLGWRAKYRMKDVVRMMVDEERQLIAGEKVVGTEIKTYRQPGRKKD
jgi:GDPmannose 4,6-dehydratase